MQSRQPSQPPPLFRPASLPADPDSTSALPQPAPDGATPNARRAHAAQGRRIEPAGQVIPDAPVAPVAPVAPSLPAAQVAEAPRPEHPRPDFQREGWLNLNGRWRFSFDPYNEGEQQRWYHVPHPIVAARFGESSPIEDPFGAEIVVPFPWESRLSVVFEPRYK